MGSRIRITESLEQRHSFPVRHPRRAPTPTPECRISSAAASCPAHALDQQAHLMVAPQVLILRRRRQIGQKLAADAEHPERSLGSVGTPAPRSPPARR